MERRVIFAIVFFLTLLTTLLVSVVCFLTKQSLIDTVFYSFTAMWIMGIVSQLLMQHLYQAIIRPLAEEREKIEEKQDESWELEGLEAIEEVLAEKQQQSSQKEESEIKQ